jgi:hypothetical protein
MENQMIDIQLTQEELNTILQGLFLLEDQEWFRGQDKTQPLIEKFNQFLPEEK